MVLGLLSDCSKLFHVASAAHEHSLSSLLGLSSFAVAAAAAAAAAARSIQLLEWLNITEMLTLSPSL